MSNHTPGPWTLNYYAPTEQYFIDFEGGCATVIGDNVESKARLIAAAPEMRDALRKIMECSDCEWSKEIAEIALTI